jgi:hypothetical protein
VTAPCDACPFCACPECSYQWKPGSDAASWPEPLWFSHKLRDDPLERFVTDWHAWDAAGRPEESAA